VRIFNAAAVPRRTSRVVPVSLLGGIQLLCTGIIGQYLAKIYMETKGCPRFNIDETVEQMRRSTAFWQQTFNMAPS
jgi:hypothetical protein